MCIGTTNAERVDANPICPVNGELRRHHRHLQLVVGEADLCAKSAMPLPTTVSRRVGINSLAGFGVLNLMLGGIVRCSKARTALMRLLRPDDPSEWPRLGFTEPI